MWKTWRKKSMYPSSLYSFQDNRTRALLELFPRATPHPCWGHSVSEPTPPSAPAAWAYPLSLAQSGNSLPRWEDESTAGWTGKVTQSSRGALRASLPRSAGPPSNLPGVRVEVRRPRSRRLLAGPRARQAPGPARPEAWVWAAAAHFSGTRRRPCGCPARSQDRRRRRPPELDD